MFLNKLKINRILYRSNDIFKLIKNKSRKLTVFRNYVFKFFKNKILYIKLSFKVNAQLFFSDGSRLILQGFKSTIYEAKSTLHSDFLDFQSHFQCSMYVQWYKKNKKGKWEELDAHLNYIFEANYEVK